MKRATVLAAALALLAAAAAPLAGQDYRLFQEEFETIRQGTKLRLGPVRVIPVFRLTDVGYDSNVRYAAEGQAPVADYTATLSPEIDAYWLATPSLIVSVMENPEYIAYAREMDLRTFANSVSGGLRWLVLRRFSLSAEVHDLSHVRRAQSEFDHRIRDTTRGGTASLYFETPRGTAIGVAGGVDDFRFEDVAPGTPDSGYGRALDRRETRAAAEAYYRVFSRSFLFSTVEWKRYEFTDPVSAWRNASSVEASGGLRFPIVGRARGTIRFGWKVLRPEEPSLTPFSGLVAGTDVAFRVGRFGLSLGLDRDFAFSYIESAYYYIDTRGRAGLSLYLFRSLRFDVSFAYGTMLYPEPQVIWVDGVPVVVDDREDIQQDLSFGPVVRLFKTTGLGLTFNLYRRTSNAPGFDISRNFVGAFLTYEF